MALTNFFGGKKFGKTVILPCVVPSGPAPFSRPRVTRPKPCAAQLPFSIVPRLRVCFERHRRKQVRTCHSYVCNWGNLGKSSDLVSSRLGCDRFSVIGFRIPSAFRVIVADSYCHSMKGCIHFQKLLFQSWAQRTLSGVSPSIPNPWGGDSLIQSMDLACLRIMGASGDFEKIWFQMHLCTFVPHARARPPGR